MSVSTSPSADVPPSAPTGSHAAVPEYIGVGGLRVDPKVTGSVTTALVVGTLGSILLVLGSFSVGWLASASPINRWQWLIPFRTQESGVMLGTVLLTLGCWVMFWAWLRLGQVIRPFGPAALKTVSWATALWCLPQLAALPIFSRDIFAYVGQGRLMIAGQDPYVDGISSLSNWFQLGADTTWAESETPYGPIFLWIEEAVVRVSGEQNPDLAIFLFRLVAVAGVVLTMIYVPLIARELRVNGAWAQWITAANPLFTISFVASGHNDALMVGLALAGTYHAYRAGRPRDHETALHFWGYGVLGVVLVTLSLGIKPITLVLLPFIGLLWAGPRASWIRRLFMWGVTAGLALAIMVVVGRLNGFGFGWLEVMLGTGTGTVPWSPVGMLTSLTQGTFGLLGLPTDGIEDTYKRIGRIISVIVVLILMFVGPQNRVMERMTWAFTALVILSPIIQPWYLLWLLPYFAVIGIRDNWQIKWTAFTVGYFLAFGASDQLFTWQFLDIARDVEVLSLVVSAICLAYILVVDRKTSRFVKDGWHVRPALARLIRRRRRTSDGNGPRP
ncbi:MAG: polyprenol phosphomannose-dependent alpha 1,6 mannosyltransferase MptB [Micrococcus sp.]|nr:polyprenol phosphomannose-dependent alpha 1,6 mannosyltransferase MptB [Micrococcus sp.]